MDNNRIEKIVLPQLPWKIVCDIVSRLPIEDIARFTCLSHGCYSIRKNATFVKLQQNKANQRIIMKEAFDDYKRVDRLVSSIVLIDECNKDILVKVKEESAVDSKSGSSWKSKKMGSQKGKTGNSWEKSNSLESKNMLSWKSKKIPVQINGEEGQFSILPDSCNGLLCVIRMYSNEIPIFIYNPITKESFSLPLSKPLLVRNFKFAVGFGFDCKNNKYKVVKLFENPAKRTAVVNDEPPLTHGKIITVGESSWRLLAIPYEVKSAPVFSGGALHWMADKKTLPPGLERILVLDLSTEKFQTIEVSMTVMSPTCLTMMNFEDSIAIIDPGNPGFNLTKVFTTKNGYQISKRSYEMRVLPPSCSLSMLGFQTDGNFLLKCTATKDFNKTTGNSQLALYCPMKKKFLIFEVSGVPNSFAASLFTPTFVSPSTLI